MNDILNKISAYMNFTILEYHILSGGVTNNTYLVITDSGNYILRIAGKGTSDYINRNSETYNMKIASQLGIIPHVYYMDENMLFMEYIESTFSIDANIISNSVVLKKILNTLITLHFSDIQFYEEFNIFKNIQIYKDKISLMHKTLPLKLIKHEQKLQEYVQLLTNFDKNLVPCHIDPKLNNFLLCENKIFLIDWEYSNMADIYFELANFVLTNLLDDAQEDIVIENYFKLSGQIFNKQKYLLYKIATDYLWIYWHLIKLYQNEHVNYNNKKWKERLCRALSNCKKMEEIV